MSTTKSVSELHRELVERCGGIVKHWRDDLLVHDLRCLEDIEGAPFLHFSRECGTHLVALYRRDQLPAKGEVVTYLFGSADAKHIVSQLEPTVRCIERSGETQLILYWDGEDWREMTWQDAKEVAEDYCRRMNRQLREEE